MMAAATSPLTCPCTEAGSAAVAGLAAREERDAAPALLPSASCAAACFGTISAKKAGWLVLR
jgi:hypothetical protein